MTTGKPLASLSLDLDDLWTYLKTRGDPAWEGCPSYLPTFVPQALDLLERLGLQITVFVVGADAVRLEPSAPSGDCGARTPNRQSLLLP